MNPDREELPVKTPFKIKRIDDLFMFTLGRKGEQGPLQKFNNTS